MKVVTAPARMRFVRLPLTVIVALRVSVQLVEAAREPPLKEKEVEPGVPVRVPPQAPVFKLGGFAMIIPAGMLSVNAMPVRAALFGLTNWTLKVDAEPPKTVKGLKPFTTPIVRLPMIRSALAAA